MHIDAAMAGSALLLPEMRHLVAGIDGAGDVPGADSLGWNPHKWMGTILDCSLLYVRDPEHLVRVMSTNPSYLRSAVDGEVTQYKDWGIPLGRRFRALKLWFHLRLDGVEAIRARLRRDLANARWFAEQVRGRARLAGARAGHPADGVHAARAAGPVRRGARRAHAGVGGRVNDAGWRSSRRPCWTGDGWCGCRSAPRPTERADVEALWACSRRGSLTPS